MKLSALTLLLLFLLFLPAAIRAQTLSFIPAAGTSCGSQTSTTCITGVTALTVAADGNLYLFDSQGYRVRKMDAKGVITTVAGTGVSGYGGDGAAAAPTGMVTLSGQTYLTSTVPSVTINSLSATVYGAALAPGFAGLYQMAVQVPATLADGDWPIQVSIGGQSSPAGAVLALRH